MWEKLKNDKYVKDLLIKLVTILFIAIAALLLFDVLTQSKDGRQQIVDLDGGTEYQETSGATVATEEERRLEQILSDIKGVGTARVMISYEHAEDNDSVFSTENTKNNQKVEGVIVTAEGAGDIIVRSNIIDAVVAVFDIPAANVMVFEKSGVK